jgi:cytochrome c oxidase cbb3-type subunit 4
MDINDVRAFTTVLIAIVFAGVCWWAFAPRRKKRFEDAANLPFADEPSTDSETPSSKD